jgi:prepilin-type N-terminal cleavage/methylation domain-containing protein
MRTDPPRPNSPRAAGLTLVELMVTVAVLAIATLGVQSMFQTSLVLAKSSHNRSMVAFDLGSVVRHVRVQPYNALMDPEYQEDDDPEPDAKVPHGGLVDPSLYSYDEAGNVLHLPEQEMYVYYLDQDGNRLPLPDDPTDPLGTNNIPLPFQMPDLLTFEVECRWIGPQGSPHTETVTAARTR